MSNVSLASRNNSSPVQSYSPVGPSQSPPMAVPLSETQSTPTGYPNRDTFEPSTLAAQPNGGAAAPKKKKKKGGFFKKLLSALKPIISQLIPGLGSLMPS